MDDPLQVTKRETGVLRVFQITDYVSIPYSLKGEGEYLEQALGGVSLNPQEMQSISANELSEAEVKTLLLEGYDIAPQSINMSDIPFATSALIFIRSAAFEKKPATLKLNSNAKLVATFTEGKAPAPKFTPLESDAAKGVLTGPASDAKLERSFGQRLAWIALIALIASGVWVYSYYIGF